MRAAHHEENRLYKHQKNGRVLLQKVTGHFFLRNKLKPSETVHHKSCNPVSLIAFYTSQTDLTKTLTSIFDAMMADTSARVSAQPGRSASISFRKRTVRKISSGSPSSTSHHSQGVSANVRIRPSRQFLSFGAWWKNFPDMGSGNSIS